MATKYHREDVERWTRELAGWSSARAYARANDISQRTMSGAFERHGLGKPGDWTRKDGHEPSARLDQTAPVAPSGNPVDLGKVQASNEGAAFNNLARFCKRQARTLEDVADFLDLSPARAREQVAAAQDAGCALQLAGDRMVFAVPDGGDDAERVAVEPADGETYRFAVVSDVHFGSKHCRDDFLVDFCRHAYERGCRTFLNAGDNLDGAYSFSVHERRSHGFDDQADEMLRLLPQAPDCRWVFVDGNHDETLSKAGGFVAGRALVERARAQGREDLTFIGQRRAMLQLDSGHAYSPRVELWHPKQGRAYALSYRGQKRIESFQPGMKPDFLIIGHTHSFSYICERGVHAISAGTFQGGGSAFGKALGSSIAIGGTIVSYQLTEGGTLRSVQIERVAYYEKEDVRRVDL